MGGTLSSGFEGTLATTDSGRFGSYRPTPNLEYRNRVQVRDTSRDGSGGRGLLLVVGTRWVHRGETVSFSTWQ